MSDVEKKEEVKEQANPSPSAENVADSFEMQSMFSEDINDSVADEIDIKGGDENVYATSLKNENVVDGAYKSVVRFIKNPRNTADKTMNIFSKFMYFLPNPNNLESTMAVDCTSNWGQRDNIVTNAFFWLKNTKTPSLEQLAKKHFSRKRYWFTLLQIVKDIQQPELEGKIKVFRFANQINEKIEDITKDDAATNQKGVNYSHPFTGVNFIIHVQEEEFEDKVTKQKQTMTSYSKSKFVAEPTIFAVPDVPADQIKADKDYAMKIFEYCRDNSPKLEDYQAKPWDEETEKRIIESVRITIGDDNIFNEIYRKTYGKPYTFGGTMNSAKAGEERPAMDISEEHLMGSNAPATAAPETTGSSVQAGSDDLPADLTGGDSSGMEVEEP